MLKSALLMKFMLIQIAGSALLMIAGVNGWIKSIIEADQTHLVLVIAAVFFLGVLVSTVLAVKINSELNNGLTQLTEIALKQRISWVQYIANTLILLGLIGTVLGFIIALSGVDPDSVSDVNSIAPMVSTLISGMSTALYTTLVGSVLNLWLMLNYRVLAAGTVRLIDADADEIDQLFDDFERFRSSVKTDASGQIVWPGMGGK